MSETPKFDLSRIKLTNGMAKFKTNEIALPKNNFSDKAKVDKPASQKADTPDTVKADKVTGQKTETPDTAKADKVASQKIETLDKPKADKVASQTTKPSSIQQKNITESAKEIQKLLAPLQATYPTKSAYEKQVFVNKFREEIRKNFRVQELLTSGGVELIKILCEPLDIPIEMGEKWLKTAQNCR